MGVHSNADWPETGERDRGPVQRRARTTRLVMSRVYSSLVYGAALTELNMILVLA